MNANSSHWQDALEPQFVKRLTRPLWQPGINPNRLSSNILERSERFQNRLPLLTQQMKRWGQTATLTVGPLPIVYAQPVAHWDGSPKRAMSFQSAPHAPGTTESAKALPIVQPVSLANSASQGDSTTGMASASLADSNLAGDQSATSSFPGAPEIPFADLPVATPNLALPGKAAPGAMPLQAKLDESRPIGPSNLTASKVKTSGEVWLQAKFEPSQSSTNVNRPLPGHQTLSAMPGSAKFDRSQCSVKPDPVVTGFETSRAISLQTESAKTPIPLAGSLPLSSLIRPEWGILRSSELGPVGIADTGNANFQDSAFFAQPLPEPSSAELPVVNLQSTVSTVKRAEAIPVQAKLDHLQLSTKPDLAGSGFEISEAMPLQAKFDHPPSSSFSDCAAPDFSSSGAMPLPIPLTQLSNKPDRRSKGSDQPMGRQLRSRPPAFDRTVVTPQPSQLFSPVPLAEPEVVEGLPTVSEAESHEMKVVGSAHPIAPGSANLQGSTFFEQPLSKPGSAELPVVNLQSTVSTVKRAEAIPVQAKLDHPQLLTKPDLAGSGFEISEAMPLQAKFEHPQSSNFSDRAAPDFNSSGAMPLPIPIAQPSNKPDRRSKGSDQPMGRQLRSRPPTFDRTVVTPQRPQLFSPVPLAESGMVEGLPTVLRMESHEMRVVGSAPPAGDWVLNPVVVSARPGGDRVGDTEIRVVGNVHPKGGLAEARRGMPIKAVQAKGGALVVGINSPRDRGFLSSEGTDLSGLVSLPVVKPSAPTSRSPAHEGDSPSLAVVAAPAMPLAQARAPLIFSTPGAGRDRSASQPTGLSAQTLTNPPNAGLPRVQETAVSSLGGPSVTYAAPFAALSSQNSSTVAPPSPVDLEAMAAKVERRLLRRLVIESERRGQKRWGLKS